MPRLTVELCPCERNLPANHDTETSEFFVTCIRERGTPRERYVPVLGPYATHGEALANVDRGRTMADLNDPWSAFDAFGTARAPKGQMQGALGT
jgi:hypothetical protein